MSTVNTAEFDRTRPRIGRFVITGRIGRGGMGMVYRGYDEALDRDVAVKTLTVEGNLDEETRKRFEIEAKAAAKLQHPNIVTVFELGEERGMPYIAMELLPGWDLEGLLRSKETLLLPEKLDIITQVCRGLQYAHEHHVVHRDIKPSNIRLLDDGSVKIMDFGIAKLANTHVTRTGMMVGTVHYMCPEAIQGQQVDGRSDVFAVGVILYELLAGRRPFEGEGATEVLFKIVQAPMPALPDIGPLTADLQAIVSRALAKKPDDRYASAARLADDLAELRGRVEAMAAPTEIMERIQAARQLVRQGRVDEGVTRLREMVQHTPQSIEARRALRAASREAAKRAKPQEAEAVDSFPELTYQMAPTRLQETALLPEARAVRGAAATETASAMGKTLLIAGAAVLGIAVVAGVVLLGRAGSHDPGTHKPGQQSTGPAVTPEPGAKTPVAGLTPGTAQVKAAAVKLVTEPVGASVSVDGESVDGKTPLVLSLESGKMHQVTVSLEGYQARRVSVPPVAPAELKLALQPLGPPGSVKIASSYPVDVSVNGRVLAKGDVGPTVTLPAGHHTLSISAGSVFLHATREIDVQGGGSTRVDLPGVGELNIQANPDNCQIFVDGNFVDYPPILKKAAVSGRHTVSFKWADGERREESVDVESGKPVYVTGRKD
jgi:hypothetical protein